MRSSKTAAFDRFHGRRAFTLIEMMIAMSVMMLVLAAFGYMELQSLRQARRQTIYMRSHSDAMKGVEALRGILMPARFDTIVVADDGERIEFNDPWLGDAVISALEFRRNADSEQGQMLYHRDTSSGNPALILPFDVQDVQFALEESGSVISVSLATPCVIREGDERPFLVNSRYRVRSF
jgi:prepilin-type N-terminal cleavage/methylation domain-containing protein